MAADRGCLAIDIGTKHLGWAASGGNHRPRHGLILLPGTVDFPKLYLSVRNEVEKLLEEIRPVGIRFVPVFKMPHKRKDGKPGGFQTDTKTAEGMAGIQAVLCLIAGDYGIPAWRSDERAARKAILGKCDFGLQSPTGGVVAGSGREQAKAAVMDWCRAQGFNPTSHDVGDALVVWHFDQIVRGLRPSVRSRPSAKLRQHFGI